MFNFSLSKILYWFVCEEGSLATVSGRRLCSSPHQIFVVSYREEKPTRTKPRELPAWVRRGRGLWTDSAASNRWDTNCDLRFDLWPPTEEKWSWCRRHSDLRSFSPDSLQQFPDELMVSALSFMSSSSLNGLTLNLWGVNCLIFYVLCSSASPSPEPDLYSIYLYCVCV